MPGAICARKEMALNHIEWMVYGFVVSVSTAGGIRRHRYLSVQLRSTNVAAKHY